MSPLLSRRSVLCGIAVVPVMSFGTVPGSSDPMEPSLGVAASIHGRFFGAAVRPGQLAGDSDLAKRALRDCRWITPEIDMKWDVLAPVEDRWNFEPADALVAFAGKAGLNVRGHALLWEQSTPRWARDKISETQDWGILENHFKRTLGRYGNLPQWDVVNEPIDTEAAGNLRSTVFERAFGPDYVRRALETARRYAPASSLMINDYGFDYDNSVETARRGAMVDLAESLVKRGAPLGGVGIQAHLDLSKGRLPQRKIADFLQSIADTGCDIVITELDVKEANRSNSRTARDAAVAAEVRDYLDVVLDQPAVKGVITWGLSDRDSWLSNENRGLPYDATLGRKPMYWAMKDAFTRA
jgi:endo-1,4-beta-xylanase